MTRIIGIIMVVVLVLLIISVAVMPWPANVVLGGIALLSSVVAFLYARQAKKKEQDTKENDVTGE